MLPVWTIKIYKLIDTETEINFVKVRKSSSGFQHLFYGIVAFEDNFMITGLNKFGMSASSSTVHENVANIFIFCDVKYFKFRTL